MYKIRIIVAYCLPAIFALSAILFSYYERAQDVANTVCIYQGKVSNNSINRSFLDNPEYKFSKNLSRLIKFLILEQKNSPACSAPDSNGVIQMDRSQLKTIRAIIFDIWLSNALLIATMVMLPYILFSSRLAFSRQIKLSDAERLESTRINWWMKLIVAGAMTIGWMYILNPDGRGESTLEQYLIKVDLSARDSIPLYIQSTGMVPVIAGFLGWYLYMLSYFFTKLIHHDVVSARVYSLMFKKLLLTYGIAMIVPSLDLNNIEAVNGSTGQNQSMLMFLIGYFPLAAFSILKEKGLKLGGDIKNESGYLSELPGISRWQVLRLEEEGIDSMAALAYADQKSLCAALVAMSTILGLWIDIAQLYVIVGHDGYLKLKPHCKTASGFLAKLEAGDKEFIGFLKEEGIGDPAEIGKLLKRSFREKLVSSDP